KERDHLQMKLCESEARWQLAIEGSGDGIWDWNILTNLVYFSPQWKAMLGYEEHEIGNNLDEWKTRVHPDDLPGCCMELQKHLRGETPIYRNEHRILSKDGSYKWILDRGRVIERTKEGKALRAIGIHSDITELKHAEEVLRESEKRMANIIDFLPDATFAVNKQGVVIAWNRAIEDMTGIAKEDMIGRGDYAYSRPFFGEPRPILIDLLSEDVPKMHEKYLSIERRDSQLIGESFAPNLNNGKGAFLWGIASLLYDSRGNVAGAIQSIRDVTGRKHEEIARRESEERFRTIFESSRDALMTLSLPSWKFSRANPAALKIFGIEDIAELVEMHPVDLSAEMQPDGQISSEGFFRMIEKALQNESHSFEWTFLKPDGEKFVSAVLLTRIQLLGETQILASVRDISEEKKASEALKHSEKRLMRAEEIARFGHWEISLDKKIFRASKGARRIYGLGNDDEDIISKVLSIPLPQYRSYLDRALEDLTLNDIPYNVEFKIKRPNDGQILDIHSLAEYDPEKRMVFGVINDVTERKKAEEALREREFYLRTIFDTSTAGIIIADDKGTIIQANRRMSELFRRPLKEIIGYSYLKLPHPDELKEA
ncbi:MAG TPA: PAS domain S-box protein, partial [Methanothrix sp.]|nr:PAS domain S-box protein [Methanothrix sp.]